MSRNRTILCLAPAIVLATGCVPGLDEFRVIGAGGTDAAIRRDAAVGIDGGADAARSFDGGGGGGDSLLERHGGCEGIFASKLLQESFDAPPSDFRVAYGSIAFDEGSAVFEAPQDFAWLQSLTTYRDVASCATVRMARSPSASDGQELRVGLRGPMHGVSFNLIGSDGSARLVSLEPDRNVLVARENLDWPSGERTFEMLVFLEAERIYAEIRDTTTGRARVFTGRYAGAQDSVEANFEGSGLVVPAHVENMILGSPTSDALRTLRD